MAGKSKYPVERKAAVYLHLELNDGNVKRTARETNTPVTTVRQWKVDWETNGVPDEVLAATTDATDAFISEATEVRDMLLGRLRELAPESKDLRAVATTFGIVYDKIEKAKAGPANRPSDQPIGLSSPDEVRALLGGWMAGALAAQNQRDADIVETDAVDVEPAPALPTA